MSIQSKTTTGVEVTLTGGERHERPVVQVSFHHPQLGAKSFESDQYGTVKGNDGIIGYIGSQRACVTVPRADFDAAMAEAKTPAAARALERKAAAEVELAALKSGETKIALRYVDGEYLSGYTVDSPASGLLRGKGLAEDVSGWGTHVDSKLVAALGSEFTYAQAAEFARPALEAKAAEKSAREAARQEKFAEARRTGKPVELARWSDGCCERDFECDLDIVTQYALPDGTTRTDHVHTH